MHFWPKFGNTDFNWWWLFARTSSKWGKFWLLSSIWPWSSRSIVPQNNRDLNQGLFHLWSKFGDSSLNGWWVIARTSWWLTDRHTHTHAGNDNTRRPKLASGNKAILWRCIFLGIQFYLPFFTNFSMTISVPVCVWRVHVWERHIFLRQSLVGSIFLRHHIYPSYPEECGAVNHIGGGLNQLVCCSCYIMRVVFQF